MHISSGVWNNSSFGFRDVIFVHSADLIPPLYDHFLSRYPLKPLPQNCRSRQTGEAVYLGCASCCLVWAWKWRAYGTPSSAMQYSKRSYIIHLFSLFFWRAFLKVSLASPFNLTSLWSRSVKSWRLGLATSHGTGWYWNDNEVVFWKEWIN